MNLTLVKYDKISEKQYLSYIKEWESLNENIVPYDSQTLGMTFEEINARWVDNETDSAYKKGFVPSTTYFLVDSVKKIYGALQLRHTLNDNLLKLGGHIGYGILPSERNKGYGTLILKLGLKEAKKINLDKVLVTCNKNNIFSADIIKSCGGILENEINNDNIITQRYWINIK